MAASSADNPPLSRPGSPRSAAAARGPTVAGEELVLRTIAAHAPSLLGTARRYSLCADDAQDAYQRGLEIFLRRADAVDPNHAVGWLRTVVKHEALAVRAGRLRLVGAAEVDLDLEEAAHLVGADERAADREHAERAAEALQRLKPQETRALLLKARGYSYREICEITGWTYTKVNRCLTEGRRAFLERFDQIASGRECARWEPVLSAVADGEASAEDLAGVRPHLRACQGCRAALRGFRAAPGAVAALAPVTMATPGDGAATALARAWDALTSGFHERAAGAAHALHDRAALGSAKLQSGVEAASTAKLAAVAASASALAGGGVAAVERSQPAPARVTKAAQRDAQSHARPAHSVRPAPPAPRSHAAAPPTSPTPAPRPRRATVRSRDAEEFAPVGVPRGERAPGGQPEAASAAAKSSAAPEFSP